jgi:hypothetical protein
LEDSTRISPSYTPSQWTALAQVASQYQNNTWVLDLHPQLSHTAEIQLETLQLFLQQNYPQINDNRDERALLTTVKKPATGEIYKLLSDRGVLWLPSKWIWIKANPPET